MRADLLDEGSAASWEEKLLRGAIMITPRVPWITSYTHSDSGTSQGGGSYGPVQRTSSGTMNESTSQSATASTSTSKSTPYTTTMLGPYDPITGTPTGISVTNTTTSTRTNNLDMKRVETIAGAFGSETQTLHDETASTFNQDLTYNNGSPSGTVNGGGTISGRTTINGSLQPGSGPQTSSYSYTLSNGYVNSGYWEPPTGGGGTPWLERLGLGTDPAAAFAFGLLQGAANIANGVVGGGDWSRGTFVYESDGAHSLSRDLPKIRLCHGIMRRRPDDPHDRRASVLGPRTWMEAGPATDGE
jgi:hypothetical protein